MSCRELWADGRLRAAAAQHDWAEVLRRYRALAGLSQTRMGELVGLTQGNLSLAERGRRPITSSELIDRIITGLQMPPELGGPRQLGDTVWGPDPELRDHMAHAHDRGRTDLRLAQRIARVLAEHRRAEDEEDGPTLWPVVRAQLDTVTALIPKASGPAADTLLLLAAEHAQWLSWVAWNEDRRGPATAWLDTAHGWAIDGGHPDMASWVMRVRSRHFLKAGDPVRALRTAEAGRQAVGLSPAARSAAAHQTSLAAAALSERDRARHLADEALKLALQAPHEQDRPGWLYFLDPTRALLQHAMTAYACRDWATAASELREALPSLEGYPRDHAHYTARLADAERRC